MQSTGLPGFYDPAAFSQEDARRRESGYHSASLDNDGRDPHSAGYLANYAAHPPFLDSSRHPPATLGHRLPYPVYHPPPPLYESQHIFDHRQHAPDLLEYRRSAYDAATAAESSSVPPNQFMPGTSPSENRYPSTSPSTEIVSPSYAYYGPPPPSPPRHRGYPQFSSNSDPNAYPSPSHGGHTLRESAGTFSGGSRPVSSGSYYSDYADQRERRRGSVSSRRGSERDLVSPYPVRQRGSTSSSMEDYPPPTIEAPPVAAERPFACDVCQLSFQRNHDRHRHQKIHLAVKPFPCPGCSKRFTRRDALKRHLMVKQHSGVSPDGEFIEADAGSKDEVGSSGPLQGQQRSTTTPLKSRPSLHWPSGVPALKPPEMEPSAAFYPSLGSTAPYPPPLEPPYFPPAVRIPLPYDHPSPTDSPASPITPRAASHDLWSAQALPPAPAAYPPAQYPPSQHHRPYP